MVEEAITAIISILYGLLLGPLTGNYKQYYVHVCLSVGGGGADFVQHNKAKGFQATCR